MDQAAADGAGGATSGQAVARPAGAARGGAKAAGGASGAAMPPPAAAQLLEVLQASVYAGCEPHVLAQVVAFCELAGLDPLLKPVHVVPLRDRASGEVVPTIVPGIGLYRTIAARCGCAGIEEPEFGPELTEPLGSHTITYPHWCRLRVHRQLPGGAVVTFTAREYWSENVALQPGDDGALEPSEVWRRRPFGQLAKCTEAQALRKAFPEIGAQPLWEELEGKLPAAAAASASGDTHPIAMPAPRAPVPKAAASDSASPVHSKARSTHAQKAMNGAAATSHTTPFASERSLSRSPTQLALVAPAPDGQPARTERTSRHAARVTASTRSAPAPQPQADATAAAPVVRPSSAAHARGNGPEAPMRSLRAALEAAWPMPPAAETTPATPAAPRAAPATAASALRVPAAAASTVARDAAGRATAPVATTLNDAAATLATPGELAYVRGRIERKGLSIDAALDAAGLPSRDSLEGLTRAEFTALIVVTT